MFNHTISPVLFHIGGLEIRYYGLVYVLGFIVALLVLDHFRKKGELKLSKEELYDLIFYLMLGTIIGARLAEVLVWNPSYYMKNPAAILMIWRGGMSFHGGLAGIIIATYWYCKKHNLNFLKVTDILTLPAAFILILGRIANFINGELPGTITDVPWCFNFPGYDGCRHPSQLYNAGKRTIILVCLIFLNKLKKAKGHKDGFLFSCFVFLMGIGRFLLDFLRDDARYLGLSMGQYLSIVMIGVGAYGVFLFREGKVLGSEEREGFSE